MKEQEEKFENIWKLAHANAEVAVLELGEHQQNQNAWGSIYVSLDGEFGAWLCKKENINAKKEFEFTIPYADYDSMQAYARAFYSTLKEYGVESRNDIAYN